MREVAAVGQAGEGEDEVEVAARREVLMRVQEHVAWYGWVSVSDTDRGPVRAGGEKPAGARVRGEHGKDRATHLGSPGFPQS